VMTQTGHRTTSAIQTRKLTKRNGVMASLAAGRHLMEALALQTREPGRKRRPETKSPYGVINKTPRCCALSDHAGHTQLSDRRVIIAGRVQYLVTVLSERRRAPRSDLVGSLNP